MGTQTFKEFVQRLFTDEAFRDRFVSAPDDTLAQCSLAADEKAALLRLSSRLANVTPNGATMEIPTQTWP